MPQPPYCFILEAAAPSDFSEPELIQPHERYIIGCPSGFQQTLQRYPGSRLTSGRSGYGGA
jgi:hypothetical protein